MTPRDAQSRDHLPPSARPSFLLGAAPVTAHLDSLTNILHTTGDPTGVGSHALSAITARLTLLEDLCADAYQYCGANDAPVPLLDNLSMASAGRTIPHPPILGLFPDRLQTIKNQLAEQTRHLDTIRPLLTLLHRLLSTCNGPDAHLLTTALTMCITPPHSHSPNDLAQQASIEGAPL